MLHSYTQFTFIYETLHVLGISLYSFYNKTNFMHDVLLLFFYEDGVYVVVVVVINGVEYGGGGETSVYSTISTECLNTSKIE